MNDELRQRLARIDPMHPGVSTRSVTDESSRRQLETIMSTPTKERPASAGAPNRTWIPAVAAVAALVVAVAGIITLGDGPGTTPQAAAPLELKAGGEDAMASCIMFSPEELARVAEIAFEGRVTAVDGARVTLTVDHWFKGGGDITEVVLNAPLGMEALIGGIPFAEGEQYLISAQDGNVNYCGFSGPSTPEFRAAFEAAFGA
ncbi:MAG: hypothetical protein ACRDVL_12525 [Acidimicrobiia bacterium]